MLIGNYRLFQQREFLSKYRFWLNFMQYYQGITIAHQEIEIVMKYYRILSIPLCVFCQHAARFLSRTHDMPTHMLKLGFPCSCAPAARMLSVPCIQQLLLFSSHHTKKKLPNRIPPPTLYHPYVWCVSERVVLHIIYYSIPCHMLYAMHSHSPTSSNTQTQPRQRNCRCCWCCWCCCCSL